MHNALFTNKIFNNEHIQIKLIKKKGGGIKCEQNISHQQG